ncbi:NAD(P)H-dependent flavin oxidoreductase [Yinghuangia soli]|uniref:Nitronate monooxygenase n=1 Tax=Yinghuangia soli TaxID=2908204 RepID=A0AA41PXD4_9ACTN|nr:nitronate monooxygenase [Yinghuangia soli]MCF2526956.1 nitronate monooxygenase [Yinghuangia soli]
MSVLSTRLTERYDCRYPFACAGMAFAGEDPRLAIAVTNAGGIGALGVGVLPADTLRASIRAIREQVGDRPFNVNLITFFGNDDQVAVCAEERVPITSFHWGHPPAHQLKALADAGVSVWEQVGSAAAAEAAAADGVDVVIAQGQEAGGHNYGELPTLVNVPTIVDAVGDRAIVLAAGGITDGRQAAAALCLGADGVWVGTRMVASAEANVHPEHHRRLVEATGTETVLSSIYNPEWPEFNPMRLHRTRLVDEWNDRLPEVVAQRDSAEEIGSTPFLGFDTPLRRFDVMLPVPGTVADAEQLPWLMGQGVGLIRDIKPAAEIVDGMMRQAEEVLTRFTRSTRFPS